jgi:hypothetical protein
MNNQDRRKSLFYISLITIGMVLLSASLSELQFQPGMPIPGAESYLIVPNGEIQLETHPVDFGKVLQFPLALAFALILIVLIVNLVKKVNFNLIYKLTGGLLVLVLTSLLLDQIQFTSLAESAAETTGIEIPPIKNYDIAPIGDPPQTFSIIVTILLLLSVTLLVTWLLYQTLRHPRKGDSIASLTEEALQAIDEENDLSSIIIRCYLQMEKIAREEQGIERAESVTPREFERLLTVKGIPFSPIHQLTALFEKVRYGGKVLDLQDEQKAIDSLFAIRAACIVLEQKSK